MQINHHRLNLVQQMLRAMAMNDEPEATRLCQHLEADIAGDKVTADNAAFLIDVVVEFFTLKA